MSYFLKLLLRTNFEGPGNHYGIFKLFDFKISAWHYFCPYFQIYIGHIYFQAFFREYKTLKMGFQLTISNFLKFVPFSTPNEVTYIIIEDKHLILCFFVEHHAHFIHNSEPTFQCENVLTYCHLKIMIFAKSGKFSDLIFATHNSPINLQNTHIFGFADTTPSL